MKGILLFTELAKCLKTLKGKFDGSILNLGGSLREFSTVEEMLDQERDEFEVSFLSVNNFDIFTPSSSTVVLNFSCTII